MDKLVDETDLFVLNLQDDVGSNNPRKFAKDELRDNCIAINERVSADGFEGAGTECLPLEKSDYFWWYQYHKVEIDELIKDDIYIPNLAILEEAPDKELCISCSWPTHTPFVLPKVDWLVIQKKYKKLFRTVEKSGLVSYQTVMEKLGSYFNDFEHAVPDLKILTQQNADKIKDKFNTLPIERPIFSVIRIAKDGFVNVKRQLRTSTVLFQQLNKIFPINHGSSQTF